MQAALIITCIVHQSRNDWPQCELVQVNKQLSSPLPCALCHSIGADQLANLQMTTAEYFRRYRMFIFAILLLMVVVSVTSVQFDDDEGEGYSKNYCANYICPKYFEEMLSYLSGQCDGDFEDLMTSSNESVDDLVPASAFFILLPCSFFSALIIGVILGKDFGM